MAHEGVRRGLGSALALVAALAPQLRPADRGHGNDRPDGRVGPIAGLRYKISAARRAGTSVLVVPTVQADRAHHHAGDLKVIGVVTLDEALQALGGRGCHSR